MIKVIVTHRHEVPNVQPYQAEIEGKSKTVVYGWTLDEVLGKLVRQFSGSFATGSVERKLLEAMVGNAELEHQDIGRLVRSNIKSLGIEIESPKMVTIVLSRTGKSGDLSSRADIIGYESAHGRTDNVALANLAPQCIELFLSYMELELNELIRFRPDLFKIVTVEAEM